MNQAEELHPVRVETGPGRIGFEPCFGERRFQGFLEIAVAEMQRHYTPGADGAAVEFRSGPTEDGMARAGLKGSEPVGVEGGEGAGGTQLHDRNVVPAAQAQVDLVRRHVGENEALRAEVDPIGRRAGDPLLR